MTPNIQTVGIPRGLLYYRYGDLWRDFLDRLGHKTVLSPVSNQKLLSQGTGDAIDECCLPFKIYLGHVHALIGQCDAVLVPHVEKLGKNNEACLRFQGLYDVVQNTYRKLPLLVFDLNAGHLPAERMAFLKMGNTLRHNFVQSHVAYAYAKSLQRSRRQKLAEKQDKRLQANNKLKILVLAQSYLLHDALMGDTITRTLRNLGAEIIFADRFDASTCVKMSEHISKGLYWGFNKELVGALAICRHLVDGVITVTAFPCGVDAMVNELLMRTVKTPPMINIVMDELQGEAGIETRIESFLDIIEERKRHDAQATHYQLSAAGELPNSNHISAS